MIQTIRICVLSALLVLAGCGGTEEKKQTIDIQNEPDLSATDLVDPVDLVEETSQPEDTTDLSVAPDEVADEACVPDCAGKECGEDGCGGSCGDCDGGECIEGLCEDLPCTGNEDCADLEQVCNLDSGECVDCLTSDDCAAEKFCDAMACLDDLCTAGEKACEGSDGTVCREDGSGFDVALTCTATEYCEAGECFEQNCSPGEGYCDGQMAVQCDPEGKDWMEGEDCAASEMFCFEGQCISSVCPAMTVYCADPATLATCNEDGTEFTTEPCPDEQFCSKGECKPWLCTPGEPLCQGNVATNCDAAGMGPVAGGQDCLNEGLLCIGGLCTKCYPDCFGKECGDDGCGGSCGACDDGDACTTGSCDEALFVCEYEPVADCCNTDDECIDGDDCTTDACVDNACVYTDICCESHDECDDGDDLCTHDLCLNQACTFKAIPGAGCCPGYALKEGFEFGVIDWSLTANNIHKWQLSADTAAGGAWSLLANKANASATLTLPGTYDVTHAGSSLRFWYVTQGWGGLDCEVDGLVVEVNGKVAERLCTAAPTWTEHVVDLSAWAGKSVTIKVIYGVNPKLPANHLLYLDEVSVEHACCATKDDCDDGNFCTQESCVQGTCVADELAGCCNPALLQEDFEDFDPYGWSLSADGKKKWQVTQDDKHTGSSSLVATIENAGALVTLPGSYAIPASGGKAKVWFKTVAWNTITWGVDGLSLYVNGKQVETISTPSPQWTVAELDLSDWAGGEVTLSFGYTMGATGNPGHRVYLDDLQVLQSCCDDDAQCDDGMPCTDDSCGNWGGCLNEAVAECCEPVVFAENFDFGNAPGFKLSSGTPAAWQLTDADSSSGSYSVSAAQATNGAELTLPLLAALPSNGGELSFKIKTVNWNTLNCATDGLKVYVNGAPADTVCEGAADWTVQTVDLMPWTGQELTIVLKYSIVSGGNWNHAVYVDDVTVQRICCAVDGDCGDGNGCTHDVCEAGICENMITEGCCGPALYDEDFDLGVALGWSLSANGGAWAWALSTDKSQSGTTSLAASVWNGQPVATLPAVPAIPASGATLEFAYQTANWNVINCETEGVRIWVNGVLADAVCTPSVDEWAQASIDLSAWAGKDVTIQLQYLLAALGNAGHAVWLDNVQVKPSCCADDAECDDGNPCTVDTCGQQSGCVHAMEAECCAPSVFEDGFEDGVAWAWSLSGDNGKKWFVMTEPVHAGTYSLGTGKANSQAVATLPTLPLVPWEGGYLSFHYLTESWNQLDCATMGIVVRVNGAVADIICEPALEWTMHVVDLYPWAGEVPEITLQYTVSGAANGEHKVYLDDVLVAFECP